MPPPLDLCGPQVDHLWRAIWALAGVVGLMGTGFAAIARFMWSENQRLQAQHRSEMKELQAKLDVQQEERLEEQKVSLPVLGKATEVLENLLVRRSRR